MGLKGLNYFLAGLVFTAGCSSSRVYETRILEKQVEKPKIEEITERTKLRDEIGYENIELKHLDELDFSGEETKIPTDLEKLANFPVFQTYRDKEAFRKELYEKYGLSRKTVSEMSPRELIMKAADIVADNFTSKEKIDPELHGFIEDDWKRGVGDCSMYSTYMEHIFNLLKEDNEKARNTHIASSYFFGKPVPHAWNAVFVVSKNKLQIGMVDSIFYDNGDNLEALDDFHLSKAWRVNFYQALGDYEGSRKQCIEDMKQVEDEREKLLLLKWYAFSFYIGKEYEKAIEAYQELAAIYPKLAADNLYYQGRCFLYLGEKEKAQEKFKELIIKYPESYWVRVARRNKFVEE